MDPRVKALIIAAGAALALTLGVTVLLVTGVVSFPKSGEEGQGQEQEQQQQESSTASWEQADKKDYSVKASDIEGIELTDLSEDALLALEATLADYAWDHQGFGRDGLIIEQAQSEPGSPAKRYKLADKKTGDVYTLKYNAGKWTLSEGFSQVQSTAQASSGSASSTASGQSQPSSASASAQAQSDSQAQSEAGNRQSTSGLQQSTSTRSHSNFNSESSCELGSQQCAELIGANVAQRLLADLNAYLKPTGLQAASASQVRIDSTSKSQKGNVLKFKALVEDATYSAVIECTYDVENLKHAFEMAS